MPGYKDWIDTIDIKIDYYSAFMKAWIAFNAWYNYSGEIAGKNDKEHIDSIAQTSNRFREYIVNLLRAEDSEGASYRDNVANLHEALQNAALMTQEYIGTRQAISFSSVASKNLNAAERFDYYKNHYECTRIRGKIITSVKEKSTGVEIFHFEQDEYDEEALQQQSVYVSLTPTQQESCLRCYGKMTPYVIESVLSKPEDVGSPDRSKKIGAYSFVKLEMMYVFENELSKKHPDNHNVRAKIRQQLQKLRDCGMIDFLGNGRYHKTIWGNDMQRG